MDWTDIEGWRCLVELISSDTVSSFPSSPSWSFASPPLNSSVTGVDISSFATSGTSCLDDSAGDSDFSSFLVVVFFCDFFFSASTWNWCQYINQSGDEVWMVSSCPPSTVCTYSFLCCRELLCLCLFLGVCHDFADWIYRLIGCE